MGLEVRPAREEDAAGISRVHLGSVETWFRFPTEGAPVATDYEELNDAERWRNGGPWVLPSLCQAHLAWLLRVGGQAWIATLDGEIVGEAESFLNEEPTPLGHYLNLSVLYVQRQAQRRGVGRALLEAVRTLAVQAGCERLLIGDTEEGAHAFYARCGFSPWQSMVLARVPCGRGPATGHPFDPCGYDQVAGLPMPVGRFQGARQEWERLRAPSLRPAVLGPRRQDWRLLEVVGEPAWVVFSQSLFQSERVLLAAWTRASPDDLLPVLLAEAGALGYARADILLEEEAFLRLRERYALSEAGRQEAWWQRLAGVKSSSET